MNTGLGFAYFHWMKNCKYCSCKWCEKYFREQFPNWSARGYL